MDLFQSHAYFITAGMLIGMLCLTIIGNQISRNLKWIMYALNGFLVANFILILTMTITPVEPHIPTPEEIYWATQPKPSFFPDGWRWDSRWHDSVANILLMVPFSVGLSLKFKPWLGIFSVLCLTTSIEIFQYFYGHGRTGQLSDVMLNTLGGVLGGGIAWLGSYLHANFTKQEPATNR